MKITIDPDVELEIINEAEATRIESKTRIVNQHLREIYRKPLSLYGEVKL